METAPEPKGTADATEEDAEDENVVVVGAGGGNGNPGGDGGASSFGGALVVAAGGTGGGPTTGGGAGDTGFLEALGVEPVNHGACTGEWIATRGAELVSHNPTDSEPIAE